MNKNEDISETADGEDYFSVEEKKKQIEFEKLAENFGGNRKARRIAASKMRKAKG